MNVPSARPGRLDHLADFVDRQRPPLVADVDFIIESRQARQGIVDRPFAGDEPVPEPLHRLNVMIVSPMAPILVIAGLVEESLNILRFNLRQDLKAATIDHFSDAGECETDMLAGRLATNQAPLVRRDDITDRRFSLFREPLGSRIDQAVPLATRVQLQPRCQFRRRFPVGINSPRPLSTVFVLVPEVPMPTLAIRFAFVNRRHNHGPLEV